MVTKMFQSVALRITLALFALATVMSSVGIESVEAGKNKPAATPAPSATPIPVIGNDADWG